MSPVPPVTSLRTLRPSAQARTPSWTRLFLSRIKPWAHDGVASGQSSRDQTSSPPASRMCRGLWVPVVQGGRPSGSSSSRFSSRMGREQQTLPRVKFYLLSAQCAPARNQTKPFQDAFQIPDTRWAEERAASSHFPSLAGRVPHKRESPIYLLTLHLERQ